MRTFLLLPLLVIVACAPAHVDTSIPFVPLDAPDTLRTATELAELLRTVPVVNVDERSINAPEEPMEEGSAFLVKRSGERWLAFPLPLHKDRRSHFELKGFSPDGRFFIAEQRSSDFTLGQELHEVELHLIDLERLTGASVTTLSDNFEWEIDDKDEQHDHRTRDSSVVSITDTHVHLLNGCTVNGKPMPCEQPSISYTITPEALVPDYGISLSPVVTGASQLPAPPGGWERHSLRHDQRVCPGRTDENRERPVVENAARAALLQYAAASYAGATLRFGAKLPFDNGLRITLLCERDDDHDLLWLTYDQEGVLHGVDTLASTFGDGQYQAAECIHLDPYGRLLVESVHNETLRDEVDTMAYRCDTLVYEPVIEGIAYADESGAIKHGYQLRRRTVDLTRCWVEKHPVDQHPPYQWHSLREVIPAGRVVFQQASGDLNGDGAEDHAFVLTNEADDGPRDLLIVFTLPARGRFVQHALLPGFLPDKQSGGFHDPIGEEGISGISINADTLVIAQFGGSAWKWQSEACYVFDAPRNGFCLVEQRSRSYHAPSLDTQVEELSALEAERRSGTLSEEQEERYVILKKMVAEAAWTMERFQMGAKPLVP